MDKYIGAVKVHEEPKHCVVEAALALDDSLIEVECIGELYLYFIFTIKISIPVQRTAIYCHIDLLADPLIGRNKHTPPFSFTSLALSKQAPGTGSSVLSVHMVNLSVLCSPKAAASRFSQPPRSMFALPIFAQPVFICVC